MKEKRGIADSMEILSARS